jgi:Cof subfamily protein (haloacid dehalogenase superfamily)
MMNNKKFKALMLDLDGTTIPNVKDGMPSKKVIEAILKAKEFVHVGVVTGRPYFAAKNILDTLQINAPSIFNGGGKIVSIPSGETLWHRYVPENDLREIFSIIKSFDVVYTFSYDSGRNTYAKNLEPHYNDTISVSVPEINADLADRMIKKLDALKDIATHKVVGYENEKIWLHITHAEATKQHGILEVAKMLDIETHEIIGIGDGYNDFPMLMACGLKVAMGNAVSELKEIADYIAPTVEEDGVADVIEKFIL